MVPRPSSPPCLRALAGVAAVLLLAGCTPGSVGAGSPDESRASASSAPGENIPSETATTPAGTGAPAAGSMEEPATTAGPLSTASFPTPDELGPGWSYAVDTGDVEEGYSGNGTPSLARRPREIVLTAVPLGCERPAPMPAPAHALEVDYTLDQSTVIAVRSAFGDPARAEQFFSARERNLRGCAGRSASRAIGPLVASVTSPAPGAVASMRTPRSDPWQEIAVLDGESVVLVALQGPDSLTPQQTRRLVALLRT